MSARPAIWAACALLGLIGGVWGTALAAEAGEGASAPPRIRLEPGENIELICPPDATRSVRQALNTQAGEAAPGPASSSGRAPPLGRAALRVGLWGDSHTASGFFVEGMLSGMRVDGARTLPSFLAATWAIKGQAQPLRQACASASWQTQLAHLGAKRVGAGLVALTAEQGGSRLAWDFRWPSGETRVQSVRLHLSKREASRGLILALSADGGAEALVNVEGEGLRPLEIELARPAATLQLRLVSGEVSLHGLSPSYTTRAAQFVDVFSIPGATVEGWRHAEVRGAAFSASKPTLDLALLQYGTNEAPDADRHPEAYRLGLEASLRQFRAAYPGVRCVLLGPPDRGGRGPLRDFTLVHFQVSRMQAQAAQTFRCEFWNWQSQMGGMRSAAAAAARQPPLVQPDLTHLTGLGYRESGRAFGAWLAQRR